MATAEKVSLLKNTKIKIKDKDKEENANSNNLLKFNISGEEQKDEASFKISQDIKENPTDKLDLGEHEEEKNSNSKIIKENSAEINDFKNSSKEEEEKSDNKSGYNYKNSNNKEGEDNVNYNGSGGSGDNPDIGNNNNSSFLNSRNYNNNQMEDENEESNDNNNSCLINRTKPFLTTGKFMQIQPHFHIFSKQINDLHNGIYENSKKCLIYKSSLQQSENFIRDKSNTIVRDLVDKIFNLRQLFGEAGKNISNSINEVNDNVIKLTQIQAKTRQDMNECNRRIHCCENNIGYKLLGKPSYSFMKRAYNTTTK